MAGHHEARSPDAAALPNLVPLSWRLADVPGFSASPRTPPSSGRGNYPYSTDSTSKKVYGLVL